MLIDRLIRNPIFIVGPTRSGTNLFLNIMRSHPEACSPRGELHEVFKGKGNLIRRGEPIANIFSKLARYMPILLEQGEDTFSIKRWAEPKRMSVKTRELFDKILYEDKILARGKNQNLYIKPGKEYKDDEIREARLLCKIVDGLVFICREVNEIYPDARFIGVVRDPNAVCESWVRRGKNLKSAIHKYRMIYERMLADSESMPNYQIYRYEDLIKDPIEVIRCLYDFCNLSLEKVDQFRMEIKRHINEQGLHVTVNNYEDKSLVWYEGKTIQNHFVGGVNANQVRRLKKSDLCLITNGLHDIRTQLGYIHTEDLSG